MIKISALESRPRVDFFFILSRLLSRIQEIEGGKIAGKTLYDAYYYEHVEQGWKVPDLMTKKGFFMHLINLFPNISKTKGRISKTDTMNFYIGLLLKPIESLQHNEQHKPCISDIPSFLPEDFNVKHQNTNTVLCEYVTDTASNGHQVIKNVLFCEDGHWELKVGETSTKLSAIGIDEHYSIQKESINLVCQMIRKMELCQGIPLKKYVVCSRFHTLETWKSRAETGKRLRSISCSRVVSFISQTSVCRICQKMTLGHNTKEKEPIPVTETKTEKETKTDLTREFKKLIPDASENMLELLISQATNVGRDPRGRRWSKSIISLCLQLFTRSPKSYSTLMDCQMLVLPSPSLLILYKNNVQQKVGFQKDIFKWMSKEAKRLQIPKEGLIGAIVLDEMAIQSDVQITKSGDVVELVGFVDVGEEGNLCEVLKSGKNEKKLGTHALQLLFLGLTGFRFPFAHFISTEVHATEIHCLFWEAVSKLKMYGFDVAYTCMDGAPSNRNFMHINLGKDPTETMCAPNPCYPDSPVIFMMDYSHGIKKIRNNILKSGICKGCTRNLTLPDGKIIQWQMWVDAFKWDQGNGLALHRKLTTEHIFPGSQSKMRNHLAEEVLDAEMLHMLLEYQSTLGSKGAVLNGAIQLLKQTSKLIEIFRDRRPVRDIADDRLKTLQCVLSWFVEWQTAIVDRKELNKSEKSKMLMSGQCFEDLQSCIIGFEELCQKLLTKPDYNVLITPALVNSDAIENEFNQQRSTYNGANTNPNALQYRRTLNSIILGQNIVSTKSNAGKSISAAKSFAFENPKPLKSNKRKVYPINNINPTQKIKVIRM